MSDSAKICPLVGPPIGKPRYNHQVHAPILLLATLLSADLTIDHVTVCGNNLKEMQAALASIGIQTEFGGKHSNGATQMAVASFPDGSYMELMAPQTNPDQKALADHYWSKQMLGNAGPTAWAVRAKDVTAEVERLAAAHITVSSPSHSGRQRPDGQRLEWETARVGPEPNGTFFPFLIRDFTPREARAFPNGKPSGPDISGVKRVIIAVRDLNASAKRFQQAYGLSAPTRKDDPSLDAHTARFEGTPIILAAPRTPQSWIAKRIQQFGEGPCAFTVGSLKSIDTRKLSWHLSIESPTEP